MKKKYLMRRLSLLLMAAALPLMGSAQRVSLPYGYAARGGMSYCPNTYLPGWMAVDPDQPVQDATFLIKNPDFSSGTDGWNYTKPLTVMDGHASMSGKFDVYQVIEDIPNGVYELSVNGFYEGQKSRREAYVYAGMETMALKSRAEGNGDLSSGHYARTVRAVVVNHRLRIGVKGIYAAGGATSFDNFSLTCLVDDVVGVAAEIADGYDGEDDAPSWVVGDEVAIHAGNAVYKYRAVSGGSQTTTLVAEDTSSPQLGSEYTAVRPYNAGKESGKLKLPATQSYIEDGIDTESNPMAARMVDGTLKFKNVCGLLKLNLKGDNVSVKTITVKAKNGAKLYGTGTLNYNSDNPTWTWEFGGGDNVKLSHNATIPLNNTAKPFYIALPPANYSSGLTVTVTDGTTDNTCTIELGATTITRSAVTTPATQEVVYFTLPEGALSGEFTVGMDGTTPIKVHFSKGNLWYDKTPETGGQHWGFEANQYDFRTYPGAGSMLGGNYSTTAGTLADTYGLFGWGDAPADGGDINTSKTDSEYTWPDSGDPWGSKIGDGWRTLTKDEWTYLLNVDNAGSGARDKNWTRFAKAKVMGVPGLLVFPDNTTGTTIGGVTISSANVEDAAFAANTINDASDWSNMESAGVVFLPCAGYRNGSTVISVWSSGRYWSSTASSSDYAYSPYFLSDLVYPASNGYRFLGRSVRLVC